MGTTPALGLAAYNPRTGDCIAAYKLPMSRSDISELMREPAIAEIIPLEAAEKAFDRIHVSRRVVLIGKEVARYMDTPIHDWIQTGDGKRYTYHGIYRPEFNTNIPDGYIMGTPGILYAPAK